MSVLCGTIKEKSEIEFPRRKVSYFSLLTDFPLITEAGVSIQTKTKERKGMYREFIDEFVLSPSMRQYLKNRRFKCGTDHAVDLFFTGFAATEKASILQIAGSGREKSG